ncbi:MAG: peroxiredoxin [Alphaproteobacteria bacterium]|nr:peroxiredoxin [Alphaproteobacteria bacterium]MCB9930426.1 peroxiredoxin [Alphaproteobacteria bacterium]
MAAVKAGDKVPSTTIRMMGADGRPAATSTDDYFKGKKVVVFAVPGAFTPTCSAKHLPGFIEKADQIKAKGVDTIACIAVNDAFVMDAWGKSAHADGKVDMLSDGNGDLAKAMGLELDATGGGLGHRSQRFAMVVEDGKITQLNVEAPGAFEVSSAEHVLGQL